MLNKLTLSTIQGIKAAPHGVIPEEFPCFSKPIYNLYGLGAESYIMHEWHECAYRPGHMWMEQLRGMHRSWDFLVENGMPKWYRVLVPTYSQGSIYKWTTEERVPQNVLSILETWIKRFFVNYYGSVNIETIGDKLIEFVPRMASQFIDFFGDNYIDSVESLTQDKTFISPGRCKSGYSKILRVSKNHGARAYYIRSHKALKELEKKVLSIKLPWYEGRPLYDISDDPFSYRLAIVNGERERDIDPVINEIERCIAYE